MNIEQLKATALARRNAGDFATAEAIFRQVLTIAPDDVDSAHMVGVLCFRSGRAREAMHFFLRAGQLSGWTVHAITRNFGLALSFVHGDAIALQRVAYQVWLNARRRKAKPVNPLVSVIVPSYNHAAFIAEALDSVYRQTWANIELIVIDDGSQDGSVDIIRESLKSCPFPHRLIARENRGAHATINEGIALASGEYLNILNSDDCFTPARIEKMVQHVASTGVDWGFAGVEIIDGSGEAAARVQGNMADKLHFIASSAENSPTLGFALVRHNVAISTGNFFVRRAFFNDIGAFADLRYVHDQEFALRATLHAEPVYVAETLYRYRLHGSNTITEASSSATAETTDMLNRHFETLMSAQDIGNPFAPTLGNWGEYVAAFILRYGFGGIVAADQIPRVAQQLVAHAQTPDSVPTLARLASLEGVAEAQPILALATQSQHGAALTFDQFQRYRTTALAIERLRRSGKWGTSFSILEVGANTHRLLGTMLSTDRITYLDREVPAEMQGASDVIVGDATALDMQDGQFDIVVALDVFEHIDPLRRNDFLHHVNRVSRVATMIAAPFDSEAVCDAEKDANAFWNSLFGTPYRWLTEHAENGLPDLAASNKWLADAHVHVTQLGQGEVGLWSNMMKACFAAEASTDLRSVVAAINRFYREQVFANDFGAAHHYRQFLLCTRDAGAKEELDALCAELTSAKQSVDLTPLQDVLLAIQHAGKNRALLH